MSNPSPARSCATRAVFVVLTATLALSATSARATPQYAREHSLRCISCHSLPPKLNVFGEEFLARGYRLPADMREKGRAPTAPFAAWISGRYEDNRSRDFDETFLNRVELVSGGPIADLPLVYFVEWRIVSLETRSDGSLRDRSGRFEDAFVVAEAADDLQFAAGQFRALRQIDVSRRLSLSEPAVFSTSLPGDPTSDARIQSLRAFAPSGRSPGVAGQFRSVSGKRQSDGLFHAVTVPFTGELSLPLTPEARDEASFELEGPPKGAFLETFYRQELHSAGVHAFLDDERWLAQGVVTVALFDALHAAAAAGVDEFDATKHGRFSGEVEYIPLLSDALRAGAGLRAEQVTHLHREPALIPYLALSGPNESYTFLLTLQYRAQAENDALFIELSAVF